MKFAGICIYVDDLRATLDFYRRAFGFDTRFFDEALGFAELETGGAALTFATHKLGETITAGGHVRPADGRPHGVEVGLGTSDVPAAFTRAVAAGAVPVLEPKEMPWGQTTAYLRTPEGTLIGLNTPMVLEVLEERFGPPPAELAAAVRGSADPAFHRRLLGLAHGAASLAEFRREAGL